MSDKESVEVSESGAAAEGGETKPDGTEAKDTSAAGRVEPRAASDYWTTPYGGFHMSGNTGRAVYRYPASATSRGYDTAWTYSDNRPVGSRQGWTYKENNFNFYMFFGSQSVNGKYWVGYSTDNQNFSFYAWAD